MSENPYDPPVSSEETTGDVAKDRSHLAVMEGKYSRRLLGASVVCAAIAGVAYFFVIAWDGGNASTMLVYLLFGAPAVSLALMSFNCALYRNGWKVTVAELGRLLRVGALMIAFAAAGYVAFMATCCCTNALAIGPRYSPPALFGGIVTFISTLLGCVAVSGLFRLMRPTTS